MARREIFTFSKGLVAKQARVNIPEGTWEEEFGREGLVGHETMLYHKHPPTEWLRIEGPLRPRAADCYQVRASDESDPGQSASRLMFNEDFSLSISRRLKAMPYYARNADGDEVHFVHKGEGVFETEFGPLAYETGDYVALPRGTTYRVCPASEEQFLLVMETRGEVSLPDPTMVLGNHLPIDRGMIEVPEPQVFNPGVKGEWEVRIKSANEFTSVFYPFCPLDVVGWQGTMTPFKFNIRDLRQIHSHRAHVPVPAYCTLVADGVAICTFTPIPFQLEDPKAQRVPGYHRNVDYDELVFTHAGILMSRSRESGIGVGKLTWSPQGIHHGPHRKAFEQSMQAERMEATIVMVETSRKLRPDTAFETSELKDYAYSFGK
jgi:homogentisate 1,2-dioxygenase